MVRDLWRVPDLVGPLEHRPVLENEAGQEYGDFYGDSWGRRGGEESGDGYDYTYELIWDYPDLVDGDSDGDGELGDVDGAGDGGVDTQDGGSISWDDGDGGEL